MKPSPPRVLTPRQLRWMLNLYPPFVCQGIRVLRIARDYRHCQVRVARCLRTRNLNGTTFGGAIYAAADPVHALLYWQLLAAQGERVQSWLKMGAANYLRPASSALTLDFRITKEDLASVRAGLEQDGRAEREHLTLALDRDQEVCAELTSVVHLRRALPA